MPTTLPRIALDCRGLAWPGIGRYCRELAAALPQAAPDMEFRWLCLSGTGEGLPRGSRAQAVELHSPPVGITEQIEVPRVLQRHRVSLFHAPNSSTHPLAVSRFVVTVHDLTLKRFPEFLPNPVGRAYYTFMTDRAVRRAARVITVSQFTSDDVAASWPCAADKLRPVWNGVSRTFRPVHDRHALESVRGRRELPERFLLYVGTCKRHKNLPRLLAAYSQLSAERRRGNPLVLIARPDRRYPEVEEAIRRTGIAEQVLWRPGVSDDDLPAIYTMARFVIMPSLYEGFGFPVAEAMACGTPSVVSRAGSLPEIGGDACIYADPYSVEDIHRALERAVDDDSLRATLSERGIARSVRFSWERAASEVAQVYREALE